ncbi:MAG: hypothetical protein QOJ37_1379, partial [Pseudonocardiales bacterium]|nr:hypothetical protein [Pseudonocardiales bacterium]
EPLGGVGQDRFPVTESGDVGRPPREPPSVARMNGASDRPATTTDADQAATSAVAPT